MLSLLEPVLASEGISYVRLDGATSAKRRAELLRAFHSHAAGERGPRSPICLFEPSCRGI